MIDDVAREYSPLRPTTWCDSSIGIAPSMCAGYSSRKISRTRSSCTGFTTLFKHHDECLRTGVDELADAQAHVVLVERPEHLPT